MPKILLAIDPIDPDKDALDFVSFLARLTGSRITAVFLENISAEERQHSVASSNKDHGVTDQCGIINTEISINWLKEGCVQRDVNYRVHRNRGVPLSELITESRFADILVVNGDISFNKEFEGGLSGLAKDILKKSECPVIISPHSFEAIDELIFTYDGSASSVFAMKQFTYLFPQLHDKKVTILQVNREGVLKDMNNYILREWLKDHYQKIHFRIMEGETDTQLLSFFLGRKNIFIVMGAYGEHTLSIFPKKSKAEILIKTLAQPVFITHA